MLTTKDVTLVYETLLMFPGMNDALKIPLAIKRKTLLMLAKIIEFGIKKEDEKDGVLSIMDEEMAGELKSIVEGLLEKGGLAGLNEKLNTLNFK